MEENLFILVETKNSSPAEHQRVVQENIAEQEQKYHGKVQLKEISHSACMLTELTLDCHRKSFLLRSTVLWFQRT